MISLEKVLGAAVKNKKALSTLREAVTDDLVVANPHYRTIMQWVVDFYDEYESLPTEQDAHTWFLTLPKERQKQIKSAWKEIWNQELEGYTLSFLADTALDELRQIASRNASRRLASMGDDVSPETFKTFSTRIENIRPVELSGLADLADYSKWMRRDHDDRTFWQSGISKLDQKIRGFGPELVFVMAESGKGKTTLMMNFSQAAALKGANILHISFEVDLYAMAQRYYMRISEADRSEYYNDPQAVESRLSRWFRMARGSIHMMYVPAYSVTVYDLKKMVDLFVEKEGGVDMVVLDYMDLLKRTPDQKRLPRDEQERRLSHETRTIATEYECSLISAAQANIGGYGAKNLGLRHMGGGVAKNQAADIVLGLMQNEEQMQLNQGRLGVLKVRENPGKGSEIPLYMDLDRMVIMDLDDPDARRLRENERREHHGKKA